MKNKKMLVILAVIISLGPLSINVYLPAFTAIRAFFSTGIPEVQLTLSSYLLGFALSHLVCGPLSDCYGRRPILIAGLSFYVLASILCALATSIGELVIFRFFQGVGACVAPVLVRAIVRDSFSKKDLVQAIATIGALMGLAPVVAPTIGSMLLVFGDWRWTFWFLAISGILALLLVFVTIRETLPERQVMTIKNISANIQSLSRDGFYMGCVLTLSFIYAPLFSFLSVAGFVLVDFYNVSNTYFGLYFVFIVLGLIIGNFSTVKVFSNSHWQVTFKIGILVAFIAALMLLVGIQRWHNPLVVVIPMTVFAFTIGVVSPKATSLALHNYSHMAATASAVMGFLQMLFASLSGFLAGLFLKDNPLPMAVVIFSFVILSAISYCILLHRHTNFEISSETG